MEKYLVFDIGGTYIKYALMDEAYTILERGKVPSPTANLEELIDALEQIGRRYVGNCQGIAVSMPGRIDTRRGIAHTGGAFHFIQDIPFAALVQERLGVPVTIANDGKCAANAELLDGALADVDNGAVLVLGTGTGGGIVLNGKVWMGSTYAAGEFSFLPTDLQSLFSGTHDMRNGPEKTFWASAMSASGLLQHYAERKGLPEKEHGIDGYAFFEAYDAGEKEARDTLSDFGRWAAAGIYAIQSVLDLERYAIGGGISARDEVTDTIRAALDKQFRAVALTPFVKPELVRCHYGSDANLLGALLFHRQAIQSPLENQEKM